MVLVLLLLMLLLSHCLHGRIRMHSSYKSGSVSDCWFTYMTTYDSQLHRAACEETEKQKVEVFVVATLSVLQPRHRFREVQSVHTLVKFSAADWAMVDSCLYINQRN